MKKTYKARVGYRLTHKQAESLGRFIEKKFPDGHVTPDALVEIAKPPSSPIHGLFEWNNKKAAHLYRLQQARNYIAALVVIVDEKPVRAYHNVVVEGAQEYVDVDIARKSEDLWQQVINNALDEVEAWSERYETYKQLRPIISAVKKVKKTWQKQKRKQLSKPKPKKKKSKSKSHRSTSRSRRSHLSAKHLS